MELKKQPKGLLRSKKYSAFFPATKSRPVNLSPVLLGLFIISIFIWAVTLTELWLRDASNRRSLEVTLNALQNDWESGQKTIAGLRRTNHELRRQLAAQTAQMEELKQKRGAAEQSAGFMKSRYELLRARFLELGKRYREKVQEFQKDPLIRVDRHDGAEPINPSKPKLQGKILQINPVYQFVIIDLGRSQGLEQDETLFTEQAGAESQPMLRVERLYDNLAACTILYQDPSHPLQAGQTVVRK